MADENSTHESEKSRRSVLKSSAVGLTATGLGSSIVTASRADQMQRKRRNRDYDAVYQRALEVLDRTDSVEKFRTYLENHGFSYSATDRAYNVTKGDASTDKLDEEDLQVWLTLSRPDCSQYERYRAELSFNWEWQDWDDWGDWPKDAIGITFDHTHYLIPDQNGDEFWMSTPGDMYYEGQNSQGIGFALDDPWLDNGDTHSAGVKLDWNDDSSTSADYRKVYGEYEHTWNGEWSGLTISVGMISLNWSNSGDSWDTEKDHDGEPLVENAGNLSWDDCNSGGF